jgi:hypothetical protein
MGSPREVLAQFLFNGSWKWFNRGRQDPVPWHSHTVDSGGLLSDSTMAWQVFLTIEVPNDSNIMQASIESIA